MLTAGLRINSGCSSEVLIQNACLIEVKIWFQLFPVNGSNLHASLRNVFGCRMPVASIREVLSGPRTFPAPGIFLRRRLVSTPFQV
jgi:hypothetical protein